MPLRTAITETPLIASEITVVGVQHEVDKLFSGIDSSNEFQECRASLRLPDPADVDIQALPGLNQVFATYTAIRVVEEKRLEDLFDSAQEYQSSVTHAMAEARIWNQGLDSALESVENFKLYNRRVMGALDILNRVQDDTLHKSKRKTSRRSEKRVKGLGKMLGAHRQTTIEDIEAPVEYHGDGPKLGSFRVG